MDLLELFPKHNCSLFLTHDPHKNYYQTIEQWEKDVSGLSASDWVSPEQREKALIHNSFWELHWYPDTPIGFYRLLAYDLAVLLEAGRGIEAG